MSGVCGSCSEQKDSVEEYTGVDGGLCWECYLEWLRECTCYEANGGHEPGCPMRQRSVSSGPADSPSPAKTAGNADGSE